MHSRARRAGKIDVPRSREPLEFPNSWACRPSKSPRSRTIETILAEYELADWLDVTVVEKVVERSRQEHRGRPSTSTRHVEEERLRCDIAIPWHHERWAEEALCDGTFPRITHDRALSPLELLLSYKQQPLIEKRFPQRKTDFVVAPVFLKEASRVHALRCVYFFALVVESLLEREVRRAREQTGTESLPLYPEDRPCRRPTARRIQEARWTRALEEALTHADRLPGE